MSIHRVACNLDACPWHIRGPKCRHPKAVGRNVARRSETSTPPRCPLREDPQLLLPADVIPIVNAAPVAEKIVERITRELTEWLAIVKKIGHSL